MVPTLGFTDFPIFPPPSFKLKKIYTIFVPVTVLCNRTILVSTSVSTSWTHVGIILQLGHQHSPVQALPEVLAGHCVGTKLVSLK